MSDLISRSEAIDLLYKTFDEYRIATDKTSTLGGFGSEVFKRVREIPTSYDIDKVAEKIEADGKNTDVCISKVKAIEIVKQGGVSDDVCEWEKADEEGYKNCKCDYDETIPDFFKYCPYCGKKIKVVE